MNPLPNITRLADGLDHMEATADALTRAKAGATAFAAKWNAAHPVGTPVILTRDSGHHFPTRTRSRAYVVADIVAVVLLENVSGCYALARVLPLPDAAGRD